MRQRTHTASSSYAWKRRLETICSISGSRNDCYLKTAMPLANLTLTADPWAGIQESANKYAREDPHLGHILADLSKHQTRDDKLAWALESGRWYGMRQQYYQMYQKRLLNRQAVKTQEMW